jgi:hypothetical protein
MTPHAPIDPDRLTLRLQQLATMDPVREELALLDLRFTTGIPLGSLRRMLQAVKFRSPPDTKRIRGVRPPR